VNTIFFLVDWALRSSILILSAALLLRLLQVKDSSIRLAGWTAILFGSLAIPLLGLAVPKVSVAVIRPSVGSVKDLVTVRATMPAPRLPAENAGFRKLQDRRRRPFDWALAGVSVYTLVALTLLLRLCTGLALSLRLLRRSCATGELTEGIEIRESDKVMAPLTLGIGHAAIMLPSDWRQWTRIKLDAVLAHERAHIQRHDPAVQLLSAIHRILLWFSPLSWFLHNRIVRVAEEASDDVAVVTIQDPVAYAELLLEFMQRGVRGGNWLGVPMARYGRPDERIYRVLDGTSLSHGVTRFAVLCILAIGSPLTYLVAAAHPHTSSQAQAETTQAISVPAGTKTPGNPEVRQANVSVQASRETKAVSEGAQTQKAAQDMARSGPVPKRNPGTSNLNALGTVTAFQTVNVRSRVDGQLMSVSFKEGELVQAGQLLASIDPRPYQIQLSQAEGQLAQDQAQIAISRVQQTLIATIAQLEAKVRSDQANVDNAKLQLNYAQITAPISGVAGLRLIDPGNIVHAADATGILVITQVRPIAVLFMIQEDLLLVIQSRLREGANLLVEARTGPMR
jgi:biotin carboxyl carrier protein